MTTMRSSRGRGGIWVYAKLSSEDGERETERDKSGNYCNFSNAGNVGAHFTFHLFRHKQHMLMQNDEYCLVAMKYL